MCLTNVCVISNNCIFQHLTSIVPEYLKSSGPLEHQKTKNSSFVTPSIRRWINSVLWIARSFKSNCKRLLSISAISDIELYFLTCRRHLIGMQLRKERFEVRSRLDSVTCTFLNSGHMKVKLLIIFWTGEENPLYLGSVLMCVAQFSFLRVSSVTKWEQNELETKPKSNLLHGNLSWYERQVF